MLAWRRFPINFENKQSLTSGLAGALIKLESNSYPLKLLLLLIQLNLALILERISSCFLLFCCNTGAAISAVGYPEGY